MLRFLDKEPQFQKLRRRNGPPSGIAWRRKATPDSYAGASDYPKSAHTFGFDALVRL
jgi:hypothetical protein